MNYIKILSIILIIILVSGCIGNIPSTSVDKITKYEVLKIDGSRVYYFDENGFIKIVSLKSNLFIIESNKTILEYQTGGILNEQFVLYININK